MTTKEELKKEARACITEYHGPDTWAEIDAAITKAAKLATTLADEECAEFVGRGCNEEGATIQWESEDERERYQAIAQAIEHRHE